MPRIKGMESDGKQGLLGQLGLVVDQHLVKVLVMTPGHEDLVQTAVLGVNAFWKAEMKFNVIVLNIKISIYHCIFSGPWSIFKGSIESSGIYKYICYNKVLVQNYLN